MLVSSLSPTDYDRLRTIMGDVPRPHSIMAKLSDSELEGLALAPLPTWLADRVRELQAAMTEERLSASEREEQLRLLDTVQHFEADRVEFIAELARRRGSSLREVMNQLGIRSAARG